MNRQADGWTRGDPTPPWTQSRGWGHKAGPRKVGASPPGAERALLTDVCLTPRAGRPGLGGGAPCPCRSSEGDKAWGGTLTLSKEMGEGRRGRSLPSGATGQGGGLGLARPPVLGLERRTPSC